MNAEKHFEYALKNLCSVTPIDKVTVSAICAEADLSRQAFYSRYLDKYDLSIRIFEKSFAPVAQGHRDRKTTWLESGVQHLSIYAADPSYYRNVLSSHDRSSLRVYLRGRMYEEFRHKCEMLGATFSREEESYALEMVVMATNELTFQWVEGGCRESPEEIVQRFDLCRPLILAPYLQDRDSLGANDR